MSDDDVLDYSGGGRISVNVDKLVQTEGFRRQLEGVKAMTDKAAREAFEKLDLTLLESTPDLCIRVDIARGWFTQGYQAAHDAAMAAEPQLRTLPETFERLAAIESERVHIADASVSTVTTGLLRALIHDAKAAHALLLQLQAAQQREATLVTLAEEAERGGRICRELGLGHDVQRASVWEHVAATIRAALATQPTSKGETT